MQSVDTGSQVRILSFCQPHLTSVLLASHPLALLPLDLLSSCQPHLCPLGLPSFSQPHITPLIAPRCATWPATSPYTTLPPSHYNDPFSQVCNLAWSKHASELVSTHGYSQNQILVWKYPSLVQVTKTAFILIIRKHKIHFAFCSGCQTDRPQLQGSLPGNVS